MLGREEEARWANGVERNTDFGALLLSPGSPASQEHRTPVPATTPSLQSLGTGGLLSRSL